MNAGRCSSICCKLMINFSHTQMRSKQYFEQIDLAKCGSELSFVADLLFWIICGKI
jgi:hypothetical protein